MTKFLPASWDDTEGYLVLPIATFRFEKRTSSVGELRHTRWVTRGGSPEASTVRSLLYTVHVYSEVCVSQPFRVQDFPWDSILASIELYVNQQIFGPIVSVRSTSPIGLYNDARGTLLYQICRNLSGQRFNCIGYLYNYTLGSPHKIRRTQWIHRASRTFLTFISPPYIPTIRGQAPNPHGNLENFDIKAQRYRLSCCLFEME